MSGEKAPKTDKVAILFFPLTLRKDFKMTVRNFRIQHAIPVGGFSSIKNIEKWMSDRDRRLARLGAQNKHTIALDLLGYNLGLAKILKSFNLPPTSGLIKKLEEYVLGGDRFQMFEKSQNASCALEVPTEQEMKRIGRPFIKLWVYDTATSHNDVADFTKESWSTIQFFLKNKNRRTKGPRYPDQITEMGRLNTLSIDALYKLANINKSRTTVRYSRYDLIVKILKLKINGEAVRKTLTRHKKKRDK